ncbi:L-threonylcarbamoyladenylate synthase [Thermosulfurimonas dismutans]|uniref:L-threonylcarbamoyladenylate synthase n=1 Tax=Thermosulfurimonas dismutans TaxID=999894 RepID=A0A179D4N5_9BACT|nr:L-threonylcarbamoyladenylate synthase [Thermosulfurimonas dismutans]OAQ21035.1 TsaC protein [Thermosulfurimonas dismutans]
MKRTIKAESPEALDEAVKILSSGGVVAFPTETFYGLAVDPFSESAVKRLYALKKREPGKPVILLIGDLEDLKQLVTEIPKIAQELAARFWPGPLTLVFRARPEVPPWITGGTETIAVRLSSHPVARKLPQLFGKPITGTSANPSGQPPARTAEEVEGYFPRIDLVLDGGPSPGERPSTLVSVVEGKPVLLRPGVIPWEEVVK